MIRSLGFLLVCGLAGCGDGSGGGNDSASNGTTVEPGMSGTVGTGTLAVTQMPVVADSGGASVQGLADIQGTWVNNECEEGIGESETEEFSFNGNSFTLSTITYLDNEDCTGDLTLTNHLDGTISVPDTDVNTGTAVDFVFENARLTSNAATADFLASQGMTLQDVAASTGISDINNIPVSDDGSPINLFTIFVVEGDLLRFGDDTPSFDGRSPEIRHNAFGPDVFARAGASTTTTTTTNTVPVNVSDNTGNDAINSRVVGIAFDEGEIENFFDPTTLLQLSRFVGGGSYIVLDDGTAIMTEVAPADLNFSNLQSNGEVTTLQALGISQSELFLPHPAGFTFNFSGNNNTAATGGVRLRSFSFTSSGSFSQIGGGLATSPILDGQTTGTANGSEGTYSVSGNTIELRYNDGNVVRTVFGTNGSETIVGQRRYR